MRKKVDKAGTASILRRMSWRHFIVICVLTFLVVAVFGSQFGALFEYAFMVFGGALIALMKSKRARLWLPVVIISSSMLAMFADPFVADWADMLFGLGALGGARTVRDPWMSVWLNGLSIFNFLWAYATVRFLVKRGRVREVF